MQKEIQTQIQNIYTNTNRRPHLWERFVWLGGCTERQSGQSSGSSGTQAWSNEIYLIFKSLFGKKFLYLLEPIDPDLAHLMDRMRYIWQGNLEQKLNFKYQFIFKVFEEIVLAGTVYQTLPTFFEAIYQN